MHDGWVKLHRCLLEQEAMMQDHALLAIWIRAMLIAQRQSRTIYYAGEHIELEPGQFIFGRGSWSQALGLSQKVVRARIEKLEKRASIRASKRASKYTVYSIVNWDTYQGLLDGEGPANGPANGPTKGQQRANEQERKKERRKNPHTPKGADDGFEHFWAEYPKKVAKGAARKAWAKLTIEAKREAYTAIKAQVTAKHFTNSQGQDFIPNPATWLNGEQWLDEIATAKATTDAAPNYDRTELDRIACEQMQAALDAEGGKS